MCQRGAVFCCFRRCSKVGGWQGEGRRGQLKPRARRREATVVREGSAV